MRRIFTALLLLFFANAADAQTNLIVNEFSQGTSGSKEFFELLVVGTRTCTDSTADLRNWIFDDHNGWYAGAGSGIAAGHYRFTNNVSWSKIPYGSIILIYNDGDRNTKIPAGANDPTDANHDYVYIVPISSSYVEENLAVPLTPSSPTFVYPTTGYAASSDWTSLGLANGGDAVVVVSPTNRAVANFSILFGIAPSGSFQTPTVNKANVGAGSNCYLDDNLYTTASSWIIGTAGTADETPGAGNSAANIAWINSMRVQVAAPAAPTFTITQPACATPTGTITITAPTGAGYTYSINGTTFQSGLVFAGLAPNTYTVTVKTPGNCTNTATAVINAAPGAPAAPTFTITQPTCTTPTGTITITAPTGAGLTYSINGTTFQAGTTFTNVAPNTYTVTVQNASGCTSTATATVNAAPTAPATPTFTITQPTCATPTGTITITAPTGAGLTYSINGTTFQSGTTFTAVAPNTYTVTVQNASGCTSTATATLNAAPTAPATPTFTITQPTCTTPTGTITITASTGAGLTYSINGTTFQSGTTFTNVAPNTYTVTVQNASGCTSTATAVVSAAPSAPAAPTTTVTQPTCATATGTITITAPTGAGLTYSINGTTFQSGTTFTNVAPNTYTVTVQNAAGCTSTSIVVVNAAPATPAAPTFTITQPTCSTPTGTITITAPTGAGLTYSINGTTFQAGTAFNNVAPNTYTITVQNAAGCTSTATAVVNVAPGIPAAPTVTTPVNYCLNAAAVPLTATGSNLLWYTTLTGGGPGSTTAPTPNTSVAGTFSFYVSQTVSGCESPRAQINVIVTSVTVSPITGNSPLCVRGSNTAITLANTTAGGTWSSSNTGVAAVNNSGVVTAVSAGTSVITYTVSQSGCSASATATITVSDLQLNLTATPQTVTPNGTVVLQTSSSSTYAVTAWTPAASFPSQTATSQTITAPASGPITYTATAVSPAGCMASASVTVNILDPVQDVFVPNVFTPNNDGRNDILYVYGTTIKSIDFMVFNQWGEMIFHTTDKTKGWDGRYKGVMQPVTVYVYAVKAVMNNGETITKKGSVTLTR